METDCLCQLSSGSTRVWYLRWRGVSLEKQKSTHPNHPPHYRLRYPSPSKLCVFTWSSSSSNPSNSSLSSLEPPSPSHSASPQISIPNYPTHLSPSTLYPFYSQDIPLPVSYTLQHSFRLGFESWDIADTMKSDVCIRRHGREETSRVLVVLGDMFGLDHRGRQSRTFVSRWVDDSVLPKWCRVMNCELWIWCQGKGVGDLQCAVSIMQRIGEVESWIKCLGLRFEIWTRDGGWVQ